MATKLRTRCHLWTVCDHSVQNMLPSHLLLPCLSSYGRQIIEKHQRTGCRGEHLDLGKRNRTKKPQIQSAIWFPLHQTTGPQD
jgi:hypothetical protein